LTEVFRELDRVSGRLGLRVALVVDEAQYVVGPLGFELWGAVAHAYDFLDSITLVISGSEMGLLHEILGNPRSPLYGRAYVEVSTRRLTRSESLEFLRRGSDELNLEVPESEPEDVVSALNNVIGWLTYYGYSR